MNITRKLAAYSAVMILTAGVAAVLAPGQASAHGAPMIPGSRTFFCLQDGLTPQGNIVPRNPGCAAAVALGGDIALYNWFGVLRSDAGGRTAGFIPDGQLCSGGNTTYRGFDLARDDFPMTHLTAGAGLDFQYNNWAKHPGTFFAYVTKDTWSPTRPLAWSDLEEEPFLTVTDPPAVGGPGTVEGHYAFSGTLPSNKTGRHIIYMRWVRSDSMENFFSCSDVVFDGGNGEVTGIGDGGPTEPPPSVPPPGNGACNVSFAVISSWPGGFQAEATVRAAPNPISGWTVSWTNPPGQTVNDVWNGNMLVNSESITQVRNASWNGSIALDGTATFGFIGSSTGTPAAPSATCSSP